MSLNFIAKTNLSWQSGKEQSLHRAGPFDLKEVESVLTKVCQNMILAGYSKKYLGNNTMLHEHGIIKYHSDTTTVFIFKVYSYQVLGVVNIRASRALVVKVLNLSLPPEPSGALM